MTSDDNVTRVLNMNRSAKVIVLSVAGTEEVFDDHMMSFNISVPPKQDF